MVDIVRGWEHVASSHYRFRFLYFNTDFVVLDYDIY